MFVAPTNFYIQTDGNKLLLIEPKETFQELEKDIRLYRMTDKMLSLPNRQGLCENRNRSQTIWGKRGQAK